MRKAKTDNNHRAILDDLKALKIQYLDLSAVGEGCPDILIGFQKKNYLFEIKNPDSTKKKHLLTPRQKEFFDIWTGQATVIKTTQDILDELML